MFSLRHKHLFLPLMVLSLSSSIFTACSEKNTTNVKTDSEVTTDPKKEIKNSYAITEIVKGSEFCGVHGLGVDAHDNLYAGSVVGERVYRIDLETGKAKTIAAPPKGNADDIEFLADGTMVWTSISQNAVRAKKPEGEVFDLAKNIISVNSIAYNEKDNRLFVAQVFGGDGLWELDPDGEKPPRNIMKDIGGLNGFDIGPDGMIYGPLWFKKKIVKINPDTADIQTIAEGFHTPAAANFDSNWNLYVLDTGTGEVYIIDIKTGAKKVFVKLKPSLDNLAIDSNDQIYVSNMADNSIQRIDPKTKVIATIVKGGLSCPLSAKVISEKNGDDTLYLADIFALREINSATGIIKDLQRSHKANAPFEYPTYVTGDKEYLYIIADGFLQQFNRADFSSMKKWIGVSGIQAISVLPNDQLAILHDLNSISIVSISKTPASENILSKAKSVTNKLQNTVAMSKMLNNKVYVTQRNAGDKKMGKIIQIDLTSGETKTIIENLLLPQGIDILPNGKIVVMTGSPGEILKINPVTGEKNVLADNINVGRLDKSAGSQSMGVTVSQSGNIYIIADGNNSILKISPKR